MPVFILGSPRSATSTVGEILRRYGGFAGHPEGHLWPLFPRLTEACRSYFVERALPLGLNNEAAIETIAAVPLITDIGYARLSKLLEEAFRNAVAVRYREDWVDKTPGHETIIMAPQLREVFPTAKFIYCYREPRANLISRMAKFPGTTFESHCLDLALCWRGWVSVRQYLGESYTTVSQSDLRDDYAKTAARLLKFARGDIPTLPAGIPIVIERFASEAYATPWTPDMEQFYLKHCVFIEDTDEIRHIRTKVTATTVHHTKFLPIIAGQPGIRLQSEAPSAIFTDVDELGSWLFLHPGPPQGPVTEVTFERFALSGENRFSTTAMVSHAESEPVRFQLKIRPSQSSIVMHSAEIVLQALEVQPWVVVFEPLYGEYDIALSTQMANMHTRNTCAWAKLLSPAFLSDPVGRQVRPCCSVNTE